MLDKKLKKIIDKVSNYTYENRYISLYDIARISVDDFINKIKNEVKDLIDPVIVFDNNTYEDGYTSLNIQGRKEKTKEELEEEILIIKQNYEIKKENKKIAARQKKINELKLLAELKKKYDKTRSL